MKEYKNVNEITVEQLIDILEKQDKAAVVINGNNENIRIYPGRENKTGGKSIIMIC